MRAILRGQRLGLFWLLFYLLALSNLNAAIEWETSSVSITKDTPVEAVTTEFHGVNSSVGVVEIASVRVDCACLSYVVSSNVVQPGEKVRLWVRLGVRDGGGELLHKIVLSLNQGGVSSEQTLEVAVSTPLLFDISTRQLIWGLGDVTPKTVDLRIYRNSGVEFSKGAIYGQSPSAFKLNVNEVDSRSPDFRLFRIVVQPSFPSALEPVKRGAVAFVGVELVRKNKVLQTLIEVISWPVPPPSVPYPPS